MPRKSISLSRAASISDGAYWCQRELQFLDLRHNRISGGMRDVSDAVMLSSRAGSTRYEFTFKESFVRPGPGQSNWSTRTNYPGLGVVQTGPAEMSLYLQRDYGQSTAHLQRLSLRLDGFASLHAPYRGGEMVTRPITFEGSRLEINYSTSAAGSIRVEVQTVDGKPIPGFSWRSARRSSETRSRASSLGERCRPR